MDSWDLNNTATAHLVLLPTERVRLLHWNRSDHLTESLRSGVAWANMRGCEAAAEWARHGEGGSGRHPKFDEALVVAVPAHPRPLGHRAAAMVAGASSAIVGVCRMLVCSGSTIWKLRSFTSCGYVGPTL